jgi:hypothetical protein
MADKQARAEPPDRQRIERVDQVWLQEQEWEYRKGYDSLSGPPPEGSALTPEQAAGIAALPPSDQSSQDEK